MSGVQQGFGEFISKEDANYIDNHGTSPERCGICYHYAANYCTKVLGNIDPNGWCMFFFKPTPFAVEEEGEEIDSVNE